jgi:hypothetical protein
MLLTCPRCARGISLGELRPESGLGSCTEHGEVRPLIAFPTEKEESRSAHWSTMWSREGSAYRYRMTIHDSMQAVFARFPSEWGGGAMMDPAEVALSLPFWGLTFAPRLLSPRITIGRRRVRFGLRSLRMERVGAFAVVSREGGGSQLTAAEGLVVLLDCRQPAEALFPLRDALNEALFVVRHQSAPGERGTPYRG